VRHHPSVLRGASSYFLVLLKVKTKKRRACFYFLVLLKVKTKKRSEGARFAARQKKKAHPTSIHMDGERGRNKNKVRCKFFNLRYFA
jgi:hypothetical protein